MRNLHHMASRDPEEQRPHRDRGDAPDLPCCQGRGPALRDPGRLLPGAEPGDRAECLVADGMLMATPAERFDLADARRTDQLPGRSRVR